MSPLLRRRLPSILHSSALPIPPTYRKPLLLATGAAAVSAPLLAYSYQCYTEWLALGKGGVPYNVGGWLAQSTMHVVAQSDVREPVPRRYASAADVGKVYGDAGARSYLRTPSTLTTSGAETPSLPQRKGARPAVPAFVAPQRQTSDGAPAHTVNTLTRFLTALAAANPDLFEVKTSGLEGPPHQALWLRQPSSSPSPEAKEVKARLGRGAKGEWAHVHGEGSAHVTLSPVDAAQAISKGWAERHAMSGVGGTKWAMAPWGYVLLYAPRDEAEFEVWREIVLASARYVSQGREKGVVVPKGEE